VDAVKASGGRRASLELSVLRDADVWEVGFDTDAQLGIGFGKATQGDYVFSELSVNRVMPGSQAAKRQLGVGAVLLAIDGGVVATMEDLLQGIETAKASGRRTTSLQFAIPMARVTLPFNPQLPMGVLLDGETLRIAAAAANAPPLHKQVMFPGCTVVAVDGAPVAVPASFADALRVLKHRGARGSTVTLAVPRVPSRVVRLSNRGKSARASVVSGPDDPVGAYLRSVALVRAALAATSPQPRLDEIKDRMDLHVSPSGKLSYANFDLTCRYVIVTITITITS